MGKTSTSSRYWRLVNILILVGLCVCHYDLTISFELYKIQCLQRINAIAKDQRSNVINRDWIFKDFVSHVYIVHLFLGIVTVLPMESSVTTVTATTVPTTWTMRRSAQERSSPVWTETPWLFIQRSVRYLLGVMLRYLGWNFFVC